MVGGIVINNASGDNNVIATYPLGGDELRGLLKVENGQLVAYGDIKDSSGNIDVIFGHLIFDGDSDENWQLQSGVTRQILFIPPKAEWNMKTSGFDENLLVAGFITTTTATTQPNTAYLDSGYLNLVFPPNTFSDLSHARTWLSNNNVEFIYTLATPTTASGTPFTNPMLCGSTEEFTDTRSLKMFCGHDSLYYTSNFKYW